MKNFASARTAEGSCPNSLGLDAKKGVTVSRPSETVTPTYSSTAAPSRTRVAVSRESDGVRSTALSLSPSGGLGNAADKLA